MDHLSISISVIFSRYFLLICVLGLLLGSKMANGQCTGGTGDNLFSRGDFGSGVANSVAEDPQIAPGYNYITVGPPNDGQYIISNNLGGWPGLYGTWLPIRDNSDDPNGYMLVVNASFEPGLFYEEVVDNLCENTSFEFSADIVNLIRAGVTNHSDPNVDFLIDGMRVASTGNIPKNERWNTYSFIFETAPGQTSVRLSLRNNAPGGIGNDLALDNITFRACGPISEVLSSQIIDNTYCQEEGTLRMVAQVDGQEDPSRSYLWEKSTDPSNPQNWQTIPDESRCHISFNFDEAERFWLRFATAGSPFNLSNANCRFYSQPVYINVPQRLYESQDTLCGGIPLPYGEGGLTRPGLFVQELISSVGCDSIRMITLDTIQRATLMSELTLLDPICPGQASGSIEARNISGGNEPYFLEVDLRRYEGTIATDLAAGQHQVLVKDRYQCFDSTVVKLEDPTAFAVAIGPDRAITLGEEVLIDVASTLPLSDVVWSQPPGIPQGSSTVRLLPVSDMRVSVVGITSDGCEASDSLDITVEVDAKIYIPNAFSPNDDGINDTFFISPFGKSLASIQHFEIYDRWGNVVYDYNNTAQNGWDGRHLESQTSQAVYAYRLVAILINGDTIHRAGSVQVIH